MSTYWDFAGIERFETAPAVVFAAEYDRARRLLQETPPTVNLHKWSDAAFRSLHELGFFEIVGLTARTHERYVDIGQGDTRLMRLISGSNADELERTSQAVVDLSRFIDDKVPLSEDLEVSFTTALGEAMANVSSHAYPDSFDPKHLHVGRWWIAASANRSTRSLNVVAYDQGATIPGTLPQRSFFSKVLSWVKGREFLVNPNETNIRDPDFIEFAMRFGNSSTGAPGRGQGLPQMCALIDDLQGGRLDILSRNGRCSYTSKGRFERAYLPHVIDGTLIKWIMRMPEQG